MRVMENPHAHKIPVGGGGGRGFFWKGGWKCQFYFYGCGDFSTIDITQESLKAIVGELAVRAEISSTA